MSEKKSPLRMCIACRDMKAKKEMLRIVKNAEGRMFLDIRGKAAGRGAYICDSEACVTKCCKQKLVNKVFSCAVPEEVYAGIREDFLAKSKA